MKLDAPNPDFLVDAVSAPHYFGIVPKAAVLKAGQKEFGDNPIGSGAFKFVEWVRGDHITLTRNEDYKWGPSYTLTAGGPPMIEKLVLSYIPDPQTRLNALLTGVVDGIENVPAASVADVQKDNRFKVNQAKASGLNSYFWLNTTNGKTTDLNVRKAISAAIDRDAINKTIYFGLGTPTTAFVTDGLPYGDPTATAPKYDVAAAKKFVADAGYTVGSDGWASKGGERLKIIGLVKAEHSKVLELVQAQLKVVGIEMTIQITTTAELAALRKDGKPYDLILDSLGWGRKTPSVLNSAFHSSQWPGGYNPSVFQNPQFDAAITKAIGSGDEVTRTAAFKDAQQILAQTVPVVPFIRIDQVYATSAKYTGVEPEASGTYRRFWDVRQLS